VGRSEVERPDADIGIYRTTEHGAEGIERVGNSHLLHRPSGPAGGEGSDIVLIITIVDAQGEEFHEFAGIIFVGLLAIAALAQDDVQVNNHVRTFGVEVEQYKKSGGG